MKHYIAKICILFTLSLCNDTYRYTYQTHFQTALGSFKAGENIVTIYLNDFFVDDFNPKPLSTIRLKSESIITNSFIKSFYSMQDSIDMLLYNDLSLKSIYKSVKEKKNPNKIYHSIITTDSIYYKKTIDNVDQVYNISKPEGPIYDALGIIFQFSKKLNCTIENISENFSFNEYRKGKITPIYLNFISEEKIKSPYGHLECFILSTKEEHDKFKKGDMKIWISKKSQDPIKIETQTKNGLLTLLLESIE